MNADARSNPLLDFGDLPRFDAIRPGHVGPAVDELLARARATVEAVAGVTQAPTWENLAAPLADALDELDRAWGAVHHLNAVASTPGIRSAYHAGLPKVTAFSADLAQDERLYARFKALAESPGFASLDPARRKLIENEVRDFRIGGAELPPAPKARLKAVEQELADLSARFDDHVLDATNAYALYVDDVARLAGVPADVIATARAAAQADGRGGWKLTLRMPCYRPVLTYAADRALRAELHRAYATRASELGSNPVWDNTPLIERILELRHEAAELLGYPDYATLALVPRMASSTSEVMGFLRELARHAKPFAEREYAELEAFARESLGIDRLEAWDLAFASEKLKERRHAFSDEEVRAYFPEDRVLAGLFRLTEGLYGVVVRETRAPAWDPAVRFFELADRTGAPVGRFYLDLYARPGKQGGAWMDDAIRRRKVGSVVQRPVAYLTCNFSAPVGEGTARKPATFTHDEVITLFHEFGHGLHLLLTEVDVAGVSGIGGVEWDAVELPSQFMENFCWEWDVVAPMTAHVDTGAPIPRELFDRMRAAKTFQSGMDMVRQLEYGLFDMLVHSIGEGRSAGKAQEASDAARREVAVTPRPAYDRFMQSFLHVFAGGYAAGFYSYKWAEVLSADAFSLFEELGILSPAAGERFRAEVLAQGGSRPAIDSFAAFRGRTPQIAALLRHNGLMTSA
jgi:oligopeptidase A